MKFFQNVKTLAELKAAYRKLAMQHHPDRGGDAETMKAINNEHDELFAILSKAHNDAAAEDTTGRTQPTTESPEEFRNIIELLLRLDGVEVELCGCWLWISGDTKPHKEQLKAAGCRWSSSKKQWYWRHAEAGARYSRGKKSMAQIRSKYGSQRFKGNQEVRQEIAG